MMTEATLPEIRNARLVRTGRIDCEINHAVHGWIPFTAAAGDAGLSGQIYDAAIGSAEDAVDPDAELRDLADAVRAQRDALLTACDWTQVADAPVDQAAWAVYRQALRDVPDQPGFPGVIDWPVPPS